MAYASSLLSLTAGAVLMAILFWAPTMPAVPWLAFVLVLHASRTLPIPSGWIALWVAMVAAALFNRPSMALGLAAVISIALMTSTMTMIPLICDRLLGHRITGWTSTLIFPMAWVALEFLRIRFGPSGSWGALGYSQYGNLPLMQLAAFTGIWGIAFLITWFASVVNFAWDRGFVWESVRPAVLGYAIVFSGVMIAGAARLALSPSGGPTIRAVALTRPTDLFVPGEITRIAEGNVPADARGAICEKLARLHNWFLDRTKREAQAGATLVVWPETNLLVFREDEASFLDRARRLALEQHIHLAMGIGSVQIGAPRPMENKVVLIDPRGDILFSHLKTRAVPGWEARVMTLGDRPLPVARTDVGRVGAAICYETDFPQLVRQTAGADILLVPANDWAAIKEIHFDMAAFRAIENGMSLVRAASSGLSGAVDPWGRVLGMTDFFSPGARSMVAQVPVGRVKTLYALTGDAFGWLCVAGIVLAVCLAVTPIGRPA
jgi:apolipoprotein N-acyltransferase